VNLLNTPRSKSFCFLTIQPIRSMDKPKPAHFLASEASSFRYVEKTNPRVSNLQFLTYGVYELDGAVDSGMLAHPTEETLLFCWQGKVSAQVDEQN